MTWMSKASVWWKGLLVCLALTAGYWIGHGHGKSALVGQSLNEPASAHQEIAGPQSPSEAAAPPIEPEGDAPPGLDSEKEAPATSENAEVGAPSGGRLLATEAQLKVIQEIAALSETPGLTWEEAIANSAPVLKEGSELNTRNLPRSDEVVQKWHDGRWEEVMVMARERLSRNAKDIPALLIHAQYYVETVDMDNHLAAIKRIMEALKEVNTPTLSVLRPAMLYDLNTQGARWQRVTVEHAAQLKERSAKRKHRLFFNESYLRACELDGVF